MQALGLEAALREASVAVDYRYYEGGGHNLAGQEGIREDLVERITGFVCGLFDCP